MQSTGENVIVSFYCKDPDSTGTEDCPAFYRTDRASWIVQGDRQGEHVEAQLVGLKPTETFVEIPERVVERMVIMYAKERYGVDLTGASRRVDQQHTPLPQA
ncbi:hypothetical protein SAMN05421505_13445 [Sinosporangium album]|uniref:Uncharacterized protein n=1 Tax=Sinosporangium album TaxID=504805 RepID=A0A1G8HXG9_9ACTN|nr:hypothetical protein SAMN05421505_13445 [Sinosporangium album]